MDNLFWIGFVGAALALIFAYLQKCKVMKCSEGDEKMVKIASSIRAGANAYLKQQYSTVAKVFAVVFVILLIIAFASKGQMLSRVTPFAFLTGGIWSMLAGLIGMKIATAANARTANAAHESLNHGLNVAFSSGTVMGFTVVGLGILDIVENRRVGMKCRGVYETPGGTILYKAHSVLETLCLDKMTMHEKQKLAVTFGELVYNGQWFTPLREALSAFVTKTQEHVTGTVRLKLYKGNMINAGVWSPYSLYSEEIATFGESDYNQADAAGFIQLYGLPIAVQAKVDGKSM